MDEQYRSYYVVIPTAVFDDEELTDSAKLLYGELSVLTISEGYCWASNAYLAEKLKKAPKTIQSLLKQLSDRGHISVEVERDPETNEFLRRKIWMRSPDGICGDPPLKNEVTSPQNCGDPHLKNEVKNNIIKYNNTPLTPQEGDKPRRKKRKRSEPKETTEWEPDRFEDFWRAYPCHKSRQAAIKAWDKLKPDEALLEQMARGLKKAMASRQWQEGIGIPYASTWLNNSRWEDEDDQPVTAQPSREVRKRAWHMEMIDGEETVVYDD